MVAWGEVDVEVALQKSIVSLLEGCQGKQCKKRRETWSGEHVKLNV